jgi:hypothetical protein
MPGEVAPSSLSTVAAPDRFTRFASLIGRQISSPPDDIFVQYTRSRLLRGVNATDPVVPPTVERVLVEKSFLALSTVFFGLDHHEKSVVNRGFRRYGNALGLVRQALGDQSRYQSFDLLESIIIMALFEVWQSASV